MGLFRRRDKDAASGDQDDVVIDLREPPSEPGELVWGMPTRCPKCGGFGYLDSIDVTRGVMHQHCPSCWTRWDITEEQVAAQHSAS